MTRDNNTERSFRCRADVCLFVLVLASFLAAYLPVWRNLLHAWSTSDDYSHGFFIIPVVVYILFQKQEKLKILPHKLSPGGLMLLAASLMVYVLSVYAEIKTLASLSLIPTLAGIIWFLYGRTILKEVSFPLFFLVFMIPVPGQIYSAITIPLQSIVSKTSVDLLFLSGLPILRDGNVIHLPSHTFEVVQACSGLRSLLTLLTLATVIAYLTLQNNLLRCVFVLCAVPAAVLVNIVRVMIMIVAYYFWGYNLTEGTAHTTFGVIIFVFALAVICLMRGVLLRWDRTR